MIAFQMLQFRYLFDIFSGSTPESGKGYYWDGEIPWITPEDVSQIEHGKTLSDTRRKITEEGYENAGVNLAPQQSIVLTKRAPIGNLAILGIEACCNQGCFLLVPKANVESRFYYYYLSAYKLRLQILGRGSTFMELSLDEIKALEVPKIDERTQQEIANYLDKETARIDALIQAKENLLTMISEKRQALITQAIIRGINSNVLLKPSGVSWLGDVPEHWNIERAKWLFKERDTRTQTGEETLLSLRMEKGLVPHDEVSEKPINDNDLIGYKITQKYDLVINKMRASSGLVSVTPFLGLVSPDYSVFEVLGSNSPDYYMELFKTNIFKAIFRSVSKGLGTGASGFLRMYTENFYTINVPKPPVAEQLDIIKYIENEKIKLNTLQSATEETILLLKERRIALITAAVTGQIEIQ